MKSIICSLLLISSLAPAAILIEEGSKESVIVLPKGESVYYETAPSYTGALALKEHRKVGVSTVVAGAAGVLGLQLELNIEPEDSTVLIKGGGPGYDSFGIFWKHSFDGGALVPYSTLGFARWYNGGHGSTSQYNRGMISQFLSESEKDSGKFGVNLLVGSLGAQYVELYDQYAGLSYFGELSLLFDTFHGNFGPTAGFGVGYYF